MVQTRRQQAIAAQQSAPQQPAPPGPSKPRKTKRGAKTAATEEDEDAVDGEEVGDYAVSKPKPGNKRPAASVNEEPSPKVRKVGSVSPSNRSAAGSGSPAGDASGGEQPQRKGTGGSKGKGKGEEEEEEADDENSWFDKADGTLNHNEGNSVQKFIDDRAAVLRNWSSQPPQYDEIVWKGGELLGAGAFGTAWAFYCESEGGVLIDRIVVKDTVLRRDSWLEWPRWWGNPWDKENREHMEIKVMEDIAGEAKANRCVFIRNSRHFDEHYMYRIIMNYCPYGSMHGANPATFVKKGKKTKEGIYSDGREIPEPLVWKWFEDLAKACVLMERGIDLPVGSVSRLSGKHTIVHRDIKPDNIFFDLASNQDGDWPEYPVAVLGDFGSAIYTNDEDEHNPMSYNYLQGTPGFRPRELCSMSDPVTKYYKSMGKLGSGTNIWSIGASIVSICNRESHPDIDFYTPENSIPTFNDNARDKYSDALRELLDKCVQYRVENRIGAQDLLDSISQHTAGTEATAEDVDLADGMRAGRSEPAEAGARPAYRLHNRELYRLHMSYEDGEALRKDEKLLDDEWDAEDEERVKQEAKEAAQAEKAEKAAAAKAKRAATAAAKKKAKGNKK